MISSRDSSILHFAIGLDLGLTLQSSVCEPTQEYDSVLHVTLSTLLPSVVFTHYTAQDLAR